MSVGTDLAALIEEVDAANAIVDSVVGGARASLNGNASEVFKVATGVSPDETFTKTSTIPLITSIITDLINSTSNVPVVVADALANNEAFNLGQLNALLSNIARKNGSSLEKFKCRKGTSNGNMINLGQLQDAVANVNNTAIGDVVIAFNNKSQVGFETWPVSDSVRQIVDYQELIASGASVVTNVNTSAGTFTLLGHNDSLGIKNTETVTSTTTIPAHNVNKTASATQWKARTAKYLDGVYQYDINLVEIYEGGVLVSRTDPGTSVLTYTGPVTASNGKTYTRVGEPITVISGAKLYAWNSTWVETVPASTSTSTTYNYVIPNIRIRVR